MYVYVHNTYMYIHIYSRGIVHEGLHSSHYFFSVYTPYRVFSLPNYFHQFIYTCINVISHLYTVLCTCTWEVMKRKKTIIAKATRELEKAKDTTYTMGMEHQHVNSCIYIHVCRNYNIIIHRNVFKIL